MSQPKALTESLKIIALLCLFIVLRLVFVIYAHPMNIFIFRIEELYRGGMAQILNQEGFAAFYRYRPDNYAGGSFVISALAAFCFKLLPNTIVTLKLVSIFWSGLALVIWYKVIKKWDGPKPAFLFVLLFIFPPLAFLRYTLAPIGDHSETILFAGLELLLFFELFDKKEANPFAAAGMGLILGFGIWFAYIQVFIALTIIVFWMYSTPKLLQQKIFWIFLLFLFLGFSPWILINLRDNGAGLIVQGSPIWKVFDIRFFLKRILSFRGLTPYQLFSYFDINDSPFMPSRAVIWFYRSLFLGPIGVVVVKAIRERKGVELWRKYPLAALSFFYLSLFCITSQFTEYAAIRYFIPLQPFLFYLAIFSILKLSKNNRTVIAIFAILIVVSGSLFQQSLLASEHRGYAFQRPGYSYGWLTGSPICSKSKTCLEAYLHLEKHFSLEEQWNLRQDLTISLASDLPFLNLPTELDQMEREIPPHLYPAFYFAMGYEIFARNHQNLLEAISAIDKYIKPRSAVYYQLSIFGAIHAALNRLEPTSVHEMLEVQSKIPSFAIPVYWRRRGFEWMQSFVLPNRTSKSFSEEMAPFRERLSQETQDLFIQGIGGCAFDYWSVNRKTPLINPKDLPNLSKHDRHQFLYGAGVASTKSYGWDMSVVYNNFLERIGWDLQPALDEGVGARKQFSEASGYSF